MRTKILKILKDFLGKNLEVRYFGCAEIVSEEEIFPNKKIVFRKIQISIDDFTYLVFPAKLTKLASQTDFLISIIIVTETPQEKL